jgi:nitrogen fixation/metabolism regulation signal transduction histidine kinase
MFYAGFDLLEKITVATVLFTPWLIFLGLFYYSGIRPWQSVANILMSFREDDFSIKSAENNSSDVVNTVLKELNRISDHLQYNRINMHETQKLLSRILAEVDLAVFLFDDKQELVMANRYATHLYNQTPNDLTGQSVEQLGLTFAKLAAHTSTHQHQFPQHKSRWLVKHSSYRQQGLPYQFIMLADIGENLRREELDAWHKLTRILSHEINNALTPLKMTVGSMKRTLDKTELYSGWQGDFKENMGIIDNRIDNLNRLVKSYSQLSRLPQPNKSKASFNTLLQQISNTYQNDNVKVTLPKTDITAEFDSAQLEQVLVNLTKNAIEASHDNIDGNANKICISTHLEPKQFIIYIDDFGTGVENIDNLFVPYFTTKAEGSGIGLVVSRQIIEAHGGSLELTNRLNQQGCRAKVRMPI